jgi:protein SCO1/2
MMTEHKKGFVIPLMIIVIPLLVFLAYKSYEDKWSSLPYFGKTIQADGGGDKVYSSIGEFSFTNQENKTITNKHIENKIAVFNFFFSRCNTVCPEMLTNEMKLAGIFKNDSDVKILSITVDPQTDSVQNLKEYSSLYNIQNKQWQFLTGNKTDIYRFARKGLEVIATDGDGGPDDFIHSDMLVLIDREGKIRGYYKGTEKSRVDALINDIVKLKKS